MLERHRHIGVRIKRRRREFKGGRDPEKFWIAWTRGSVVCVDVFDPAWDFWSMAEQPVDDLRAHCEVPPLAADAAADDRVPGWYMPVA